MRFLIALLVWGVSGASQAATPTQFLMSQMEITAIFSSMDLIGHLAGPIESITLIKRADNRVTYRLITQETQGRQAVTVDLEDHGTEHLSKWIVAGFESGPADFCTGQLDPNP